MTLSRLLELFDLVSGAKDPELLDHVPYRPREASDISPQHERALERAAERYGRPFKCARAGLPREVCYFGDKPPALANGLEQPIGERSTRLRIVSSN